MIFSFTAIAQETIRPKNIVNLMDIDPTIKVDMMYFGSHNFMGQQVRGYKGNICYLTEEAANGLKQAQERLQVINKKTNQHLTLMVRDCYRPHKAVQDFVRWAKDPNQTQMKSEFYPDLTKEKLIQENYISPISGHSRASSIDLTIAKETSPGRFEPIDMGTPVDFFGEKSHTDFAGITEQQKVNRQLLKDIMGPRFKNYSKEWWHYVLKIETYPKTTFDFDIVEPTSSSSTVNTFTNFTDANLLAELDQNNASELSLVNIFERIHHESKLSTPSVPEQSRSLGAILSEFKPTYGNFTQTIAEDISRLIKELDIDWEKDITKTYNVSAAKNARGKENRKNGNVTRIFNEKWLTSSDGQFLLSGIMNRIDRRGFTPGSCGEVRLIYRLGYETQMNGETYASRMPFTLNMVFTYADDGKNCQAVAKLWQNPGLDSSDPKTIAKTLLAGPLNFKILKFKQMETNAQVARFPSDLENVEKRGFAGQAIYLMRIFSLKNGAFTPKKLENTPDVQALVANPELKKRLLEYIAKNTKAIDTGVFIIPDEFLTDIAITYSTLGSSRTANKPYEAIFKPSEISVTEQLLFAKNGKGLIERLNMSSCMGCHQSSSTAGFHLLGSDRTDFGPKPSAIQHALDGNRLALPFSPHLFSELPRREDYVRRLANASPVNEFRPHPSAPPASWSDNQIQYASAKENMPCPLPDQADLAPYATWSCNSTQGLTCAVLANNPQQAIGLGQCVPTTHKIYAGLSCRRDFLKDNLMDEMKSGKPLMTYNIRAFTNQITKEDLFYNLPEGKIDSKQYNCRPTKIGVPLGRVTKNCTNDESRMQNFDVSNPPNELCAIVGGKGFEEMAKGYFSSRRFAEGVGRGLLNTCSPTKLCREDYICQEMPEFLSDKKFGVPTQLLQAMREKHIGFCTPTYFVYQLRLDGHPNPR